MGLLDGVGDAVKGASDLTAPITTPGLGEAIKTALDGPLGHVEGAAGNPLDALNHLSDLKVDLAPILGALDHPAIDATAESQLNEVMQGVIENLHSNADGVHDDGGTVVAMADTADAHAGGHADTDSGTGNAAGHADATPVHDDAAASDPSPA